MAEVMGAEAAIVRIHFVSGTHAIATALFAVLRPGDELLAVAGKPYDTMEEVCFFFPLPTPFQPVALSDSTSNACYSSRKGV